MATLIPNLDLQCRFAGLLLGSAVGDALGTAPDSEWPGGFPYSILVTPGGKIIHRQMGAPDKSYRDFPRKDRLPPPL